MPLIKIINFSTKKEDNSKLKIIGSNKFFLFPNSNAHENKNFQLAESIMKLNTIKGISNETKPENISLLNRNNLKERQKCFSPSHPLGIVSNNFLIEKEQAFDSLNVKQNNLNFDCNNYCNSNGRSKSVLKNEILFNEKKESNEIKSNFNAAHENVRNCCYSSQIISKERSLNENRNINDFYSINNNLNIENLSNGEKSFSFI